MRNVLETEALLMIPLKSLRGKVEYNISKCMYVEMFEYYGIRSLCKIFCMTDEYAYANLPKVIEKAAR